MKPAGSASLRNQARMLRMQMQAQRALIAAQIDASSAQRNGYPRSLIMRFLARRPALATRLLVELGTVLLGTRMIRSLTAARSLINVARLV